MNIKFVFVERQGCFEIIVGEITFKSSYKVGDVENITEIEALQRVTQGRSRLPLGAGCG